MSEKKNVIEVSDLVGLSKPIEKLIECVGSTVGALYEPTKIKKKAKAEAEAVVILAKADAKKTDIESRMQERIFNREMRRQENIEAITQEAAKTLTEVDNVSDIPVDEDWIYRFFEECQDIKDEEMQSIWGRILAGEVKSPKSFSYRTLKILKELTKEEAEAFTNLCSFVFSFNPDGSMNIPIVDNDQNSFLLEKKINFSMLNYLDAIGLIRFDNIAGFGLHDVKETYAVYDDAVYLLSREEPAALDVGKVMFTSIGKELQRITNAVFDEVIKEDIIKNWKDKGWTIKFVEKIAET